MIINKSYSKKLAPVMDLDYDLSCSFHTPELLEKKIKLLAEHGFERLHIVAPPSGNPDYSHAARELPENGPPNFLRQSRKAMGDNPLGQAVKFAKRAGLEVIIVFKPYEGGGPFTIPHNAEPHCGLNYIEILGGRAVGLDPFIIDHPEYLLERKPFEEHMDKPVTTIELAFIIDKVKDDAIPLEELKIYISDNNGSYEIYNGTVNITERIELRKIKDANDQCVFPTPVECRIIEIFGLNINTPYFAVDLSDKREEFRTIPYSMCSAYSGAEKLPVTVSPTVRHDVFNRKQLFNEIGFEFEELGPYYWDCGWHNCTLFGFARGKLKRLPGALCEAYPEVRAHWLRQIRNFVEMGIDGVEIRLQSHCSGVTDFINYGFNKPLVDAFSKKYQIDILTEPFEPFDLMKIRGEFFEDFIEKTKKILHSDNLKLLVQVHGFMEKPSLSPTFHDLGFWANPKILPNWRKLIEAADEVVLKDYNFGKYKSAAGAEIKNFTAATGKPLWIHCYLQQGNDWRSSFLEDVQKDTRITGMLLYEVVWNAREKHGIIKVDENGSVSWVLPEDL
jgi:hypothetical protein